MAEILLKIGKGSQTKTLVFSRNTRSPHENSTNIVSTASKYGHKSRERFWVWQNTSKFIFISYYFIYVFILLLLFVLFVFSTSELTVSTPQGKAQFVAWFVENRHSVNFDRNTDGHHQQAA